MNKKFKSNIKRAGAHVKGEVKRGCGAIKGAIFSSAKNLIGDAIIELGINALHHLMLTYIVNPLVRKIDAICKKLGISTREFLADV